MFCGAFASKQSGGQKYDVSGTAGAAAGPHAVSVPLPTSGPLAPPSDVVAAVTERPWRGGLEPCGEHPVAPLPAASIVGRACLV